MAAPARTGFLFPEPPVIELPVASEQPPAGEDAYALDQFARSSLRMHYDNILPRENHDVVQYLMRYYPGSTEESWQPRQPYGYDASKTPAANFRHAQRRMIESTNMGVEKNLDSFCRLAAQLAGKPAHKATLVTGLRRFGHNNLPNGNILYMLRWGDQGESLVTSTMHRFPKDWPSEATMPEIYAIEFDEAQLKIRRKYDLANGPWLEQNRHMSERCNLPVRFYK
jgi:hypothetical protein